MIVHAARDGSAPCDRRQRFERGLFAGGDDIGADAPVQRPDRLDERVLHATSVDL
jgi:hypothetical protein